ncbi:hypothetical protein ACSHUI_00685 [Bacillus subtilis]|uniref:hypothetical protein n=1 Tax=Bacillus subtilis TaxID=1423 RepID=UPI0025CA819F|nr:hypothetical protein [Bacillus subtilis]WCS67982.1 hypothetical protein Goe26_00700 [Bacillus phage vB_BsuM-Goe26]GLI90569.1 hypothetical protein ANABIO4_39210 [Bacillus subtilis]
MSKIIINPITVKLKPEAIRASKIADLIFVRLNQGKGLVYYHPKSPIRVSSIDPGSYVTREEVLENERHCKVLRINEDGSVFGSNFLIPPAEGGNELNPEELTKEITAAIRKLHLEIDILKASTSRREMTYKELQKLTELQSEMNDLMIQRDAMLFGVGNV